jgi:hypothetical protein
MSSGKKSYESLSVAELDDLISYLDKIRTDKVLQQQRFGKSARSILALEQNPAYHNPYDVGYKPNPKPVFYSPHVDPQIKPHHRQIDTESGLRSTGSRYDTMPTSSKIVMSPRFDLQGFTQQEPQWLTDGVDLRAGQITRDSGIYR